MKSDGFHPDGRLEVQVDGEWINIISSQVRLGECLGQFRRLLRTVCRARPVVEAASRSSRAAVRVHQPVGVRARRGAALPA